MLRGVLLDVAGVLTDRGRAVPGSVAALARIRNSGHPLRCVTNSTRRSRRQLLGQLSALGFDIALEELVTPAIVARDLLVSRRRTAHLLIHPDLDEDFAGLPESGTGRTVVVGDAADHFTYDRMNAAFRELTAGADLLALAMNRSFNDNDGALSIDAGAFVRALEYASGLRAEVIGKPSAAFFLAAVDSMHVQPDDTIMIGDDAEADVAGALTAGIGQAVLVRTGKYRPGAERACRPEPTHVFADLSEAVAHLLG